MSRELWVVERCEHDLIYKHGSPEGSLWRDHINCEGGTITVLDFDTIWDRYYEIADRRNQPGLTEDELRKVIGLEPEKGDGS